MLSWLMTLAARLLYSGFLGTLVSPETIGLIVWPTWELKPFPPHSLIVLPLGSSPMRQTLLGRPGFKSGTSPSALNTHNASCLTRQASKSMPYLLKTHHPAKFHQDSFNLSLAMGSMVNIGLDYFQMKTPHAHVGRLFKQCLTVCSIVLIRKPNVIISLASRRISIRLSYLVLQRALPLSYVLSNTLILDSRLSFCPNRTLML